VPVPEFLVPPEQCFQLITWFPSMSKCLKCKEICSLTVYKSTVTEDKETDSESLDNGTSIKKNYVRKRKIDDQSQLENLIFGLRIRVLDTGTDTVNNGKCIKRKDDIQCLPLTKLSIFR
jgi:hypothetical protein